MSIRIGVIIMMLALLPSFAWACHMTPKERKGETVQQKAQFVKADTNHDHALTLEEYTHAHLSLNLPYGKEFAYGKDAEAFDKIDADKDGEISMHEYLTYDPWKNTGLYPKGC